MARKKTVDRAVAAETGERTIMLGRVVRRRDVYGGVTRVLLQDGEPEGYWVCYNGRPAYGPYSRDDLLREMNRRDNSAEFIAQIKALLDGKE